MGPVIFQDSKGQLLANCCLLRIISISNISVVILRSESFHGCGMQNGFYDHTGRFVLIREGGGWDAGGRANPAPFWMSSRGYGALRNTYKPGSYNFSKEETWRES